MNKLLRLHLSILKEQQEIKEQELLDLDIQKSSLEQQLKSIENMIDSIYQEFNLLKE